MTENIIKVKRYKQKNQVAQEDLVIVPVIEDANPAVRKYRELAWKNYSSKPIPDGTQDDWRRTSLKQIDFSSFKIVNPDEYQVDELPQHLDSPVSGANNAGFILMTPTSSRVNIAATLNEQGVVFDTLSNLVETRPDLMEKVISSIDPDKLQKFSALAGVIGFDGIMLYVPKNINISLPLQSIYWAPGSGYVHSLHIFIYLDEGSSVTYVHESSSPKGGTKDMLHSGLFEVYVGQGAHLNFVELQSWGENVLNFTRENVQVDRDGSIDWIFGALGSKLTKNYSDLNLIGKGATGKMSGFYFTDNNQHLDHDTQQNHLAPNTTSDLLFKGALLDNSRSVWQGMIYVAPAASKTDGYQANRNLVLSKHARADSIPGLEILTDDVRCTHGATVGKLDEEQVFYLLSRGLPREVAERLIVEGFFDPVMQRIPFEGVRRRFQDSIKEKMEHIR